MVEIVKTTATNHSGWTADDGRVYNNDVCRYLAGPSAQWYYAYTYGFPTLPVGALVDGVKVDHHIAASGTVSGWSIRLCLATTLKGSPKTPTTPSASTCATADSRTSGGTIDKWGLSQSDLTTLVQATDFGVAIYANASLLAYAYEDGFQITIYYHLDYVFADYFTNIPAGEMSKLAVVGLKDMKVRRL